MIVSDRKELEFSEEIVYFTQEHELLDELVAVPVLVQLEPVRQTWVQS